MGDGIVAAHHRDQAPQPKRCGIEHGSELVAHFPARDIVGRQTDCGFLVLTRIERAERTGDDEQRDAWPQQRIAGLQRRHERGDGGAHRARKHRARIGNSESISAA